MKTTNFNLTLVLSLGLIFSSCKKNDCHECHYDDNSGNEIELGEKCGDEVEKLEAEGYTLNGTKYEAYCGEH